MLKTALRTATAVTALGALSTLPIAGQVVADTHVGETGAPRRPEFTRAIREFVQAHKVTR